MHKTTTLAGLAACLIALGGCGERAVSYKADIQPILAANCYECHSPGKPGSEASGLDVTTYQGLLKGGKFGPMVKPGDPLTSTLNMVVEGRVHSSISMPKGRQPLSERDIETLKTWVKQGAKDN